MRKILSSLLMAFFLIGMIPSTFGAGVGVGVGIDYETAETPPSIHIDPNSRLVIDDPATGETELTERMENYAFEGEKIITEVLVIDCNGKDKIMDVFGYANRTVPDAGFPSIEVNCGATQRTDPPSSIGVTNCGESCCSDPDEFDPTIMEWYRCELTVESSQSMHGQYWLGFGAIDMDGLQTTINEVESWFLNPVLALQVIGDINFGTLRPGQRATDNTPILIKNKAENGSGVLMDMYVSGNDFYDPTNSGARCPTSNVLRLNTGGSLEEQFRCGGDNFCYYASSGAYTTNNDVNRRDLSGYVGVPYETEDPDNRAPIISSTNPADWIILDGVTHYKGNMLTPGAGISMTFRLDMPLPCNGHFTGGNGFYFWGQAV